MQLGSWFYRFWLFSHRCSQATLKTYLIFMHTILEKDYMRSSFYISLRSNAITRLKRGRAVAEPRTEWRGDFSDAGTRLKYARPFKLPRTRNTNRRVAVWGVGKGDGERKKILLADWKAWRSPSDRSLKIRVWRRSKEAQATGPAG